MEGSDNEGGSSFHNRSKLQENSEHPLSKRLEEVMVKGEDDLHLHIEHRAVKNERIRVSSSGQISTNEESSQKAATRKGRKRNLGSTSVLQLHGGWW